MVLQFDVFDFFEDISFSKALCILGVFGLSTADFLSQSFLILSSLSYLFEDMQDMNGSTFLTPFDILKLLLMAFGEVEGEVFLFVNGFFNKAENTLLVSSLLESVMRKNKIQHRVKFHCILYNRH